MNNPNRSEETCCNRKSKLKDEKRDPKEARLGAEQVSLPIGGMSCRSCAGRIEDALSGCPGVIKAVVDFRRREAGVHFDPRKINLNDMKNAIKEAGYEVPENRTASPSSLRSYLIGTVAALGVVAFYLGLLTLTSDWSNARSEFGEYGLWIMALAMGLGIQVTLFLLFRTWHGGGSMKGAKCSLATSGGMSTTAMAACCSHYLTLVLPALGLPFLSSAAAGLASYQRYFFMAGILSNIFGIGFMLRLMIRSGMIRLEALNSRMIFGVGKIQQ